MRTKFLIAVAAAVVAVSVPAAAAPEALAKTRTLTASDNGKTVKLKKGDVLVIRLESCSGSCGYSWRTTKKPAGSVLRRTRTKLQDGPTGQVQVIHYAARGAGRTSLELGYLPPARGAEPEDAFKVNVVVR